MRKSAFVLALTVSFMAAACGRNLSPTNTAAEVTTTRGEIPLPSVAPQPPDPTPPTSEPTSPQSVPHSPPTSIDQGATDKKAADQAAYEKRMQDLQSQWDQQMADLQRQHQQEQEALAQRRAKQLEDCLKRASDQLAEDRKFDQSFQLGPAAGQQSQENYESAAQLCHISFD